MSTKTALARLALAGLTALAALALTTAPARADHKDPRLGFSIQTPRDWGGVPTKAAERWLVASYQSPKPNFWTEKGGWTVEHKPDMQMIAFVDEQVKELARVKKKTDKAGNTSILIELDSPYKDYKDYMQRRYTGGGWFIDKEGTTKVGKVDVTTYEIRVDKLSYDGPKRIVTWIYHVPDVDIAVQFEVLQDAWPKLQAEVTKCLKSFKLIERSGEALAKEVSTGRRLSILEADALTPEERKGWRQSAEQELHAGAQKNLPDGWQAKKFGRFLVVFHTDEKYAKRVADQAEAVWQWLEDSFGFVGAKEYVRAPILRICKDWDEERQFMQAGDWTFENLEIVTHQDFGGSTSWEMQYVNQRVMDVWFQDRDRSLYWAMPAWFGDGLKDVIGQLRSNNGQVEFTTDHWNRDQLREVLREGKAKTPRELMMTNKKDLWSGNAGDYFSVRGQSQALVTFFVSGAAAKSAKTKTVLQDYLRALKQVQVAITAEKEAKKGAVEARPTTEEEEDKMFRERHKALKDGENRILEETMRGAFGSWTDKDWKQFEDVYFQAIG